MHEKSYHLERCNRTKILEFYLQQFKTILALKMKLFELSYEHGYNNKKVILENSYKNCTKFD